MTPGLARATSSFLTYLAEPAVRSLLVGSAAALALLALRVKRAPARLQVWTAVLCAALAMPLLRVMLPRMPLAIPASAVARISEHVPMLKNSGQWLALGAQRSGVMRGESAGDREFGANNSALGRTSAHSGEAQANVPQVFRPEKLADVHRFREAKSLTPKGVSYVEGTNGSTRDARHAAALWTTEKPQVSSDGQRVGTGPEDGRGAFGVPVEMPVMPLPMMSVLAEPGISTMQVARMIREVALGIYAFVALILLARLFAGVWFSGKLERAAQEVEPLYFSGADDAQNAQAREALRMLRFRSTLAGVRNAPALKESAAIYVPATVGVRRATILLPLNWRAWSGEQLDAVLAHEVAHVARRDALVQTLSLVHRAIFWFSPLAWWLDRQLTELAEQASDEAALAGGADRTRYAETLLGFFAQLESASGRIWWQGVSMAKKSHAGRAERRVDRILAWKEGMSMKKSFALIVAALAMPVIFFAASLHPMIAYAQDKAQSADKNVIMPGGPKAPVLPKAPKGGVAAPAIAAAPQGGVQGGVPAVPAIAPAPQGGVVTPAIAPAPGTPAPSEGIEAPGPMPAAPQGGVNGGITPPGLPPAPQGGVVAPAPIGPRIIRPAAQASVAPMASMASVGATSSITSVAPGAAFAASAVQSTDGQVHAGAGVGSGNGVGIGMLHERELQEIEAQLQASLDELQRADADSKAASTKEAAEALQEIERAKQSSDSDYDQVVAAQHALEKARRLMQQSDASQVREAQRALEEAMRDLHEAREHEAFMRAHRAEEMNQHAAEMAQRAQEVNQRAAEMADRQAQRAQEMNERNQEMADRATRRAEDAQESSTRNVTINGGSYTMGGGPRYVVMTGPSGSKTVEMSGDDEDLQHARRLHDKIGKDMIWFERDEKSYIITDPAFIAKAKALFAPEEELSKQQDELGRQQDELGRQQDALGEQMDKVSVKPPDVSDDLRQIQARLKELRATGATQSELGEIQSELGRLQSEVGRVQSQAGVQQSAIGRQQGELGRKQGELGRKQGELGRRQGEIAREASRQLRGMFDDAIAKGIAKPE